MNFFKSKQFLYLHTREKIYCARFQMYLGPAIRGLLFATTKFDIPRFFYLDYLLVFVKKVIILLQKFNTYINCVFYLCFYLKMIFKETMRKPLFQKVFYCTNKNLSRRFLSYIKAKLERYPGKVNHCRNRYFRFRYFLGMMLN